MSKLDDMYRMMNVAALTRTIQNHRATMAPPPRNRIPTQSASSNSTAGQDDTDTVSGAFKIQMLYAENLKPCNKNGLANPYVVVRVPEGTVVPPSLDDVNSTVVPGSAAGIAAAWSAAATATLTRGSSSTSGGSSGAASGASTLGRRSSASTAGPSVLTGTACELARSRSIGDTINPNWDETFAVMLPPVTKLDVAILSRNILTADEVAGKSTLEFKGKLKRRLGDHQVHDVFVELEPQGRLLLRLTLEGKDEDVDFWFRRSKERLGRLRDDFVRALTTRVSSSVPGT